MLSIVLSFSNSLSLCAGHDRPLKTSCVDHKDRNDMWPTAAVAFAVVRFTPLRGRRIPGGADRGVPSTEMD